MAEWIRGRDPGRPIHDQGEPDAFYTDVYSRMYAGYDELDAIGRRQEAVTSDSEHDAHRRRLPMILSLFLTAYQEVRPLQSNEIWALPAALKLAILSKSSPPRNACSPAEPMRKTSPACPR